jgi:hypothetical protein
MIVYMLFQLVTGHLALAEPFVEQSSGAKAGLVMLSGIATAPYAVVKLAVATVGSVLGGAINLLSLGYASDTAGRIALGAADGDWYVHPDVFTGERPLHFIGAEAESELPPLPTVRQMGEK